MPFYNLLRLSTALAKPRLGVVLLCSVVLACCSNLKPELATLYKTAADDPSQPPVILIHGAFGSRLCDAQDKEHWPGSLFNILLGSYTSLALAVPGAPLQQPLQELTPCGLADTVAGRDFYGDIEATLTGAGGYQWTEPGTPARGTQRRYYRFTYDWRQDNHLSAVALDRLVEQIRTDYGDNALKVDIVAHSMGGLVARYWLRYGTTDVLDSNDFPLNNIGSGKARKVIQVATPNVGSTSALQQILTGAEFGVNAVVPEVLITFPGAFQLLPHPIVDPVLGIDGEPVARDIYDLSVWRDLRWGPYDPGLRDRLQADGWSQTHLAALETYTGIQLERARRFVWSLTVKNPESPHELIVFGGDCLPTPARILIEDIDNVPHVRLWPHEIQQPNEGIDYHAVMLEPGDGAVTKSSLLARTALDPSIPRHRYSDFPLDYAVMFCGDHTELPGNITFQDNLLHILLSR